MNPILDWLTSREEVRIATTPTEHEAIFRLRYEVYAIEKGWVDCGEDHAQRRLVDRWDEASSTRHIYSGKSHDLKGTMRLQVFEPGQVPEEWARMYALDRFPGIEKLRVAEMGRFAIRKDCRGGLVMPSLVRFAFNHLVGTEKVDLGFSNCRPSMVHHYRKIGFRPYSAPLIPDMDGLFLPLVLVPSDHAYLSMADAILRTDARRHFRKGYRKPVDTSAFMHLFEEDNQRVMVGAQQVFAELEEGLHAPDSKAPAWASTLPLQTFEKVSKRGYLLTIDPGDTLVQQGRSEREGYMILDGECEVLRDGVRVAVLGAGEPIGEMAFFLEEGRRTATVKALKPTRVLVLDRRLLDELHREQPDVAYQVLQILGRILARRLDQTTAQLVACGAPKH